MTRSRPAEVVIFALALISADLPPTRGKPPPGMGSGRQVAEALEGSRGNKVLFGHGDSQSSIRRPGILW